jgi:hypothetical protein
MNNQGLPLLSVDLIKLLDTWYPPRPPDIRDSDREIWSKAGKRELVDSLLAKLETDNVLDSLT